ncbi:hypothetical protein ABZ234_08435 [Nocardiopsis sp. NPDC006198]|uniref:hypothetical protein n=1 Tax=Nocardiopsis sp. NPDC006198 TaxID=3154472 RepID=UPI0033AB3560
MGEHPRTLLLALLGQTVEADLLGQPLPARVHPWNRWWISYRTGRPAAELRLDQDQEASVCATCRVRADALAGHDPPQHTDALRAPCSQGCLLAWAQILRSGQDRPALAWPRPRLALALLKPGAPQGVELDLAEHYDVIECRERTLDTADVRRLYPEAYGAAFVAARDAHMRSAPVRILVMVARGAPVDATALKHRIRLAHGAGELRNHLHMADNPGETFADIAHLLGREALNELHDTFDRTRAGDRLAHYRTVLG